jgi:hypothetical protein
LQQRPNRSLGNEDFDDDQIVESEGLTCDGLPHTAARKDDDFGDENVAGYSAASDTSCDVAWNIIIFHFTEWTDQ